MNEIEPSIKFAILGVLAALSFVAVIAGCDRSTSTSSSPPGSSAAYAELGIVLTDLEDEEISIVSETEKDIHVLAFWETTCVPSIDALSMMEGVHDRLASRGVEVYAVSVDGPDSISRVPGFAAQEGWTFPVSTIPTRP